MAHYSLRGQSHWYLGAKAKAIADYTTVVEKEPESMADRKILKEALLDTKNYKEACKGEDLTALSDAKLPPTFSTNCLIHRF